MTDELARVKAQGKEIALDLATYIHQKYPNADGRALAVALMEIAVNQHIKVMGEAAAMDLLAGMFQRR